MKNIFSKTNRDMRRVFSPLLTNLLLTGSFISLVAKYLQGEKLPLSDIFYFIVVFLLFFITGYGITFALNGFVYSSVYNNIEINPVQSSKNPSGKMLLHIVNNVDDDMVNVKVEFKKLLIDKSGKSESVVRADKNFFKTGMIAEDGNIISANTSSKVEIAEDQDGILKVLLENEFLSDVLLLMPEFEKHQQYRFVINVNAKVGDIFFNKDVEFPFNHWIDEQITNISGGENNKIEKHPSYLKWDASLT